MKIALLLPLLLVPAVEDQKSLFLTLSNAQPPRVHYGPLVHTQYFVLYFSPEPHLKGTLTQPTWYNSNLPGIGKDYPFYPLAPELLCVVGGGYRCCLEHVL